MDIYVLIVIILLFIELICTGKFICSSGYWLLTYFVVNVVTPLISNVFYEPATFMIRLGITGYAIGMNLALFFKIKTRRIKYATYKDSIFNKNVNVLKLTQIRKYLFIVLVCSLVTFYGKSNIRAMFHGTITLTTFINKGGIPFTAQVITLLLEIFTYICAFVFLFDKDNKKHHLRWLLFAYFLQALFSYARAPVIYTGAIIFTYWIRKKKPFSQVAIFVPVLAIGIIIMILFIFFRNYGIGPAFTNFSTHINQINAKNISSYLDFSAAYNWFVDLIKIEKSINIDYLVLFKPLFIIIPKSLWAGKPEYLTIHILKQIRPDLANSGYSTGFGLLGEAYALFGVFGCFVLPLIMGVVCTMLDKKYTRLIHKGEDKILWILYYLMFSTVIIITTARGGIIDSYTAWLFPALFILIVEKFSLTIHDKRINFYKHSIHSHLRI